MLPHASLDRSSDPWQCTLDDFRSADVAMQQCLDLARVAAQTDLPILILGESGTGKTLLAHAIHNSSKRSHGPFIAFNAAALSDSLIDSQLFGHERGAFTGADRSVKGKFELAHGGTLFIDEIADMSLSAQAKILRAVEYGEFERLGSERLQVADVRLISATHWPLPRFTATERFRKDLFYRISGITITLPPLRHRPGDLRALIAAEIAAASRQQGKTIIGLDRAAAEHLFTYAWPGNLRELKTVIAAAVALTSGDIIPEEAILAAQSTRATMSPESQGSTSSAGMDEVCAVNDPGAAGHHDLTLKTMERRHIRMVLAQVGGNKRRAASMLGIARTTLDRKLAS
ncbi:MAG TPA: sigma 54-interacting transcriptional regulator [Alphaproteobacteria bacterium]|nr:sigma 54-interacting transcriptional regulator [Alphaproteobacteria bacterium]